MKKVVFVLFMFVNLQVFGLSDLMPQVQIELQDNSLMLKKQKSDQVYVVTSGDIIRISLDGSTSKKGKYITILNDSLFLEVNNQQQGFPVNTVNKLKVYGGTGQRIVGGTLMLAGIGGFFLGSVSLIAGTIAMLQDDIGAIVLVAVPPLLLAGWGAYALGQWVHGKRFNLDKKWTVVTP